MKISDNCLNLIAKWEGFRENAYLCQANVWTIGYGTTKWPDGSRVKEGQTITKEEAWELFRVQVQQHADTITKYVKVPLNQNQYDALASLQYNLGAHILKNSTLLKYLNAKQWDKAAEQIALYNKVTANGKKQVSKGLVNRRKDEVALFKKPVVTIDSTKLQENIVAGATAFRIQSGKYATKEACIAAMNEALEQKYFVYVQLVSGSNDENGWRYMSGKYANIEAARQAATSALVDNKINFASILGRLE